MVVNYLLYLRGKYSNTFGFSGLAKFRKKKKRKGIKVVGIASFRRGAFVPTKLHPPVTHEH